MPPPKSRGTTDDPNSAVKEKHANASRGRRNVPSTLANGSSLKEVMNSSTDSPATTNGNGPQTGTSSTSSSSWAKEDSLLLHSYRSLYRLETPSSFHNPLAHVLLSQGIGNHSPTMARQKSKRRVSKDSLALAVRKNFNALAVNEQEVIVDFLYKTKTKEKELRVRFAPPRK
ncbi:hypothetical protein EJ05DRAFT_30210 [Pseudovirgaria hyperparasitica]|uniref:Histone deacetylase complex subunit SAP30 Sin3 binding domain-containing protein n=1 Tax=Pseudovirgaria hyperparasitica TaxID=470096 RepID=A0A6A6WLZ5_9PEZI|nr:uncharacterized protein EJ05DRAFT_30210 [Pseudovirgaria hyperparasitica]KAF2763227.1 hypothetical protein EJ05DRAFT_30210 [Pseudovirgaria hyperparasitica]